MEETAENRLRRRFRAALREERTINVPYGGALSKNQIWKRSRQGHYYLTTHARALRDAIALELRQQGGEWYDGHVYLEITCFKPDARGDAINVLDLVADAVSNAIEVDDSWFSASVDWTIDKHFPRLTLRVSQEVDEHMRICSSCGRILAMALYFDKNRAAPRGHARECKVCVSERRKAKRAHR